MNTLTLHFVNCTAYGVVNYFTEDYQRKTRVRISGYTDILAKTLNPPKIIKEAEYKGEVGVTTLKLSSVKYHEWNMVDSERRCDFGYSNNYPATERPLLVGPSTKGCLSSQIVMLYKATDPDMVEKGYRRQIHVPGQAPHFKFIFPVSSRAPLLSDPEGTHFPTGYTTEVKQIQFRTANASSIIDVVDFDVKTNGTNSIEFTPTLYGVGVIESKYDVVLKTSVPDEIGIDESVVRSCETGRLQVSIQPK